MNYLKVFLALSAIYVRFESSLCQSTVFDQWKFLRVVSIDERSGYESTIINWFTMHYINKPPINGHYVDLIEYFNSKEAMAIDFDYHSSGKRFLVIGGKPDVHVTLATVGSNDSYDIGPWLHPYPDYTWHINRKDCSKFISVTSIHVDECDKLWVLDSGKIDGQIFCKPKIVVFDIKLDKHIKTHVIPENVSFTYRGKGFLSNLVIRSAIVGCEGEFGFMADVENNDITSWNSREFKRIKLGELFASRSGLQPMDMSRDKENLYFASLTSKNVSIVAIPDIFAPLTRQRIPADKITTGIDILDKEPTVLRYSNDFDVLLIGQNDSTVVCWAQNDQEKDLLSSARRETLLIKNETLQHITSLKVPPSSGNNKRRVKLYILSSRIQNIQNESLNLDEINFQTSYYGLSDLLKDKHCGHE